MTFSDQGYRDQANNLMKVYLADLEKEMPGITAEFEKVGEHPVLAAVGLRLQRSLKANVETIIATFAEMEKRIERLEASGVKYCGVWQRAQTYHKGEVVTLDGAAWIALQSVDGGKPGEIAGWQLMVRAGRDAR